jgi:hypothetical protein
MEYTGWCQNYFNNQGSQGRVRRGGGWRPQPEIHRAGPGSGSTLRLFIGVFSQTTGSTCKFWVPGQPCGFHLCRAGERIGEPAGSPQLVEPAMPKLCGRCGGGGEGDGPESSDRRCCSRPIPSSAAPRLLADSWRSRAAGAIPRTDGSNLKFTGLAQNLGQLEGFL